MAVVRLIECSSDISRIAASAFVDADALFGGIVHHPSGGATAFETSGGVDALSSWICVRTSRNEALIHIITSNTIAGVTCVAFASEATNCIVAG